MKRTLFSSLEGGKEGNSLLIIPTLNPPSRGGGSISYKPGYIVYTKKK